MGTPETTPSSGDEDTDDEILRRKILEEGMAPVGNPENPGAEQHDEKLDKIDATDEENPEDE